MIKRIRKLVLSLSLCICLVLSASGIANAQPVTSDGVDVALTSFYGTPEGQEQKVDILKSIGFGVSVPLNVKDLGPKDLGNGTFQSADLDFSGSVPETPGTDRRITFSGSLSKVNSKTVTSTLYAVVAGKPDVNSCPIAINDTQIAFFDTKAEAKSKGEALSNQGYLVYVSVDKAAQAQALEKIKELNCKPNAAGVVVNGATKKVTVDFSDVFNLLPARLQQPAKNGPFVYSPKGDFIYLVNGRKSYPS